MRIRLLFALSVSYLLLVCGCQTFQSEGVLHLTGDQMIPYKHAAISPTSDKVVCSPLAKELQSKGFTVYRELAFQQVCGIRQGTPVLVFICKDTGHTARGAGSWSQGVDCKAYDLHTRKLIYQGFGEYMGESIAADYAGAVRAALATLPRVEGKAVITTIVKLPRDELQDDPSFAEPLPSVERQGTAWFIGNRCLVTSAHLVEGSGTVTIVDASTREYSARVTRMDQVNDLALLDVESDFPSCKPLSVASRPASIGEAVFTMGYPMARVVGEEIKFSPGAIASTSGLRNDPRSYQISVPVQAGNSGGPLINEEGEVIAIVTAKLNALYVLLRTG
ncbi:MAG: trypsin-like peptidase domain-containing protein, partial [Deltaproteobacteria bacterium]|nr:trypsin-like peptidase domain-containing protein [Deltaproteobacteria bacterium]